MTHLRELADTELDAVYGGTFNFASPNTVTQTNTSTQVGVAIGGSGGLLGILGGNGGAASVTQAAVLANASSIVS